MTPWARLGSGSAHRRGVVHATTGEDLKDFIWLMTYMGLRISDVVLFEWNSWSHVSPRRLLDAFLPGDGQSLLDVVNLYVPRVDAASASFFRCGLCGVLEVNDKDRAWVASKLTPQPPGTVTEKLRVSGAFLTVPRKSFIGVTKGEQPFFRAVADRYATDPAWQVHQVDCGHDVMIDKPDELTAILESSI